jgi:chemotaxis regulatin CheY-phosphate phosphatase CheZ
MLSPSFSAPHTFSAPIDNFEALEDAMLQTPRGRWFLAEYARRARGADTQRLFDAIECLTDSVNESRASAGLDVLRRELEEMSHSITQTRTEIAAIKPAGTGNNKIDSATEELDHIVRSTETATADILTASERLAEIANALAKSGADAQLCAEIERHSTDIMLACSFQDLTGQRTSKVVHALRYIEQRVNSMIQIWGVGAEDAKAAQKLQPAAHADAHLLNGPAKSGEGASQNDIDRLMSGDEPESEPAPTAAKPETSPPVFAVPLAAKGEAQPTAPPEEDEPQSAQSASSSQDDIDALFN